MGAPLDKTITSPTRIDRERFPLPYTYDPFLITTTLPILSFPYYRPLSPNPTYYCYCYYHDHYYYYYCYRQRPNRTTTRPPPRLSIRHATTDETSLLLKQRSEEHRIDQSIKKDRLPPLPLFSRRSYPTKTVSEPGSSITASHAPH